jgi:hypothetical protein
MPDEKQQLATIAAVLDDSEKLLDKLFANLADIRAILARTPPGTPDRKAGDDERHDA